VFNSSRIVYSDETGTAGYTTVADGIEDAAGNDLDSFAGLAVTNNSSQVLDVTAPTFSSAAIATDGDSISIVFDEAVEFGAGGISGLTLATNGAVVTLTYTSGAGTDTLVCATSRTVSDTEDLTCAYVQPGNGIRDAASNYLASFSAQAVTNNSTVNGAPTDISLSSSSVLTTGGLNAVVGTLSATDPDAGDTHTFALVAGTGDTDNASFNISGSNLRANNSTTLGVGTYSVRIQTSDGALTHAEAFSVSVVEPGSAQVYGFSLLNNFSMRF
jgi:hypothetical protein